MYQATAATHCDGRGRLQYSQSGTERRAPSTGYWTPPRLTVACRAPISGESRSPAVLMARTDRATAQTLPPRRPAPPHNCPPKPLQSLPPLFSSAAWKNRPAVSARYGYGIVVSAVLIKWKRSGAVCPIGKWERILINFINCVCGGTFRLSWCF